MAPKRKSDTIATSEVIPSAQAVPATKSSGPAPPPKKKQEQKQKQKQARPRSSTPIEAVPLYLSDRGFTTQRPAGLQEPAAGPVLTRTGGPSNGKAPLRFQVFDSGAQQRLASTSTPSNVQVTSVPPDVPDDSTPSDVHVDAGGNVYVGPTKEELSKMNRTQLKAAFKEETKAQELAQFEDDVARVCACSMMLYALPDAGIQWEGRC